MDSAQEIFGWAATCLNSCFYISHIILFTNLFKRNLNYDKESTFIILASYLNCFCWYIYGDMILSAQIKICNLIGVISSLCLILINLVEEIIKNTIVAILNILIITTGTYVLYQCLRLIIDDEPIIGKICNATSIIVFLSPFQLIYRVLIEKNYNLIPIYAAYILFFSSCCWVSYGSKIKNIYVIIPNVIGIILSIAQIYVYTSYKMNSPVIGEREFTSTIDIVNTGSEIEEETHGQNNNKKKFAENQINSKGKPVKIIEKIDN